MKGKFCCKSKITVYPKNEMKLKKRLKQERSSTAQRWSRRIRSLPPVPIEIIKAPLPKSENKYQRRKINSSGDYASLSEIILKRPLPRKKT